MSKVCEICQAGFRLFDHVVHVAVSTEVKETSRGYDAIGRAQQINYRIQYRSIGSHQFTVCRKCGRKMVFRRWLAPLIVMTICAASCASFLIQYNHHSHPTGVMNGNEIPLWATWMLSLLVLLGMLWSGGDVLFSPRECVNRALQRLHREELSHVYGRSVLVYDRTFSLTRDNIQLFSEAESARCKIKA